MSEHVSAARSLEPGLRRIIEGLAQQADRILPDAELLALVGSMTRGGSLTIDAAAARQIGAPLVVLRLASGARSDDRLQTLSARERDVATLIAQGRRNREIASQLGISIATVKDHVHNILAKTGLTSRAGLAAAFALEAKAEGNGTTIHPRMGFRAKGRNSG